MPRRLTCNRVLLDIWGSRIGLIFLVLFVLFMTWKSSTISVGNKSNNWLASVELDIGDQSVWYAGFCEKLDIEILFVNNNQKINVRINSEKAFNSIQTVDLPPRISAGFAVIKDEKGFCTILIHGGKNGAQTFEQTDLLNITSNQSSFDVELTTISPGSTPLLDTSLAATKEGAMLFGGIADDNSIFSFSMASLSWTKVTPTMMENENNEIEPSNLLGLCNMAAANYKELEKEEVILLYGGTDCASKSKEYAQVSAYYVATQKIQNIVSLSNFNLALGNLKKNGDVDDVFARHSSSISVAESGNYLMIHGGFKDGKQYFDSILVGNLFYRQNKGIYMMCSDEIYQFYFCHYSASGDFTSASTAFQSMFASSSFLNIFTTDAKRYAKKFEMKMLLQLAVSEVLDKMIVPVHSWTLFLFQVIVLGSIMIFLVAVVLIIFKRPFGGSNNHNHNAFWFNNANIFGVNLSPNFPRAADEAMIASLPKIQYTQILKIKEFTERNPSSTQEIEMTDASQLQSGHQATNDVHQVEEISSSGFITFKADIGCCCICLSDFENPEELKLLPCSHLFHPGCIDSWLAKNGQCPLCKEQVTSEGIAHIKEMLALTLQETDKKKDQSVDIV